MKTEYYYIRIKKGLIALKCNYRWNNSESIFAMKTAIACTLSMLIAYYLEFQQGYWASISCLIATLPSAGATAKKAFYRFGGTCLGALAAIFISGLFAQNHIAYSIAIFLLISTCFYISVFSNYSYVWFLLAVTAAIIMLSAISKNTPEDIVYIAYSRWYEVSIGILVTSFLNLLVWPQYAAYDYHKKNKEICRNYSDFLRTVFEQYMVDEYDFNKTKTDFYTLKKKIAKLNDIAEHAKFELKTARRQKKILLLDTKQLTINLNHIWEFYLSIKKFNNLSFHKSFYQYIIEILNTSNEMNKIKNDFEKHTKLIELSNSYIEQINKRYLKIKAKGENQDYEMKDVYLFQEFLLIIKEFVDFSKNKIFFNSKSLVSSENKIISYFPEEIYSITICKKEINLNIPILQYAIKVGISSVAVIWLWQFFEIPSGGSNMAVAVLLVMQPDTTATYLKGILRFLGCLLGVMAGFIFLFFQIESTFLLCCAVIIVIYIAMYIYYNGGPGISYAGLQLALAFLIAVLPEPHATMDTTLFIKRLIGIFFGVSVAWLINITIFFKDILTLFKEKLSFLQNKIACSSKYIKDFTPDVSIPDLSPFYSALNTITDQHAITIEESFSINKYLKNIDKYFRIRYLLLSTDKEIVNYIDAEIKNIRIDIYEMIQNFSLHNFDKKEIKTKINMALKKIEDFRLKIRYNYILDKKPLEFRQKICQYTVNLKRMLLTISELQQIQEQIAI